MNDLKMRAVIAIVMIIIGFLAGTAYGSMMMTKWVAQKAIHFFDLDFDEEQFAAALREYKLHIDEKYP